MVISRGEKIKQQKHISAILSKDWAQKMLSPYISTHNSNNIQSFKDFQDLLDGANSNVVSKHIKKLRDIGILQPKSQKRPKRKKGYAVVWKNLLSYHFRFQDMKLIQDCPIEHIYLETFHYDKDDKSIATNVITMYGLEYRNPQIETILVRTYKKLITYLNKIYIEKLNLIVSNECKNIRKYKLKQSIKEWRLELTKKYILYPPRNRGENKPMPHIKYVPPKELEQEFKDITERIWNQLNKECPPIGIMIQF